MRQVGGELRLRAEANFKRLHEPEHYAPEKVYRPAGYDWPGDYEGRAVLALTLLCRLLHTESVNLKSIMTMMPAHLNEKGYFGEIVAHNDEQQLSSHGWLLRGLSEYYLWQKSPAVLEMIRRIMLNLVKPLVGAYDRYPLELELRQKPGAPIGELNPDVCSGWRLSSDVGCAYILMDGAMQAAEVLQTEEYDALFEEMLRNFDRIDLLAIRAQTHASLTAARGALRFYRRTGNARALATAERVFRLYRQHGMTEHYANLNWFQRPEWTEPCAIVDSFMVADQLWQATGRIEYLRDAHRIWHTGVERSQRSNGGFGGDNCPRTEEPELFVRFWEANWCCTMRGAEGLFARASAALRAGKDGTLYIAYPGVVENDSLQMSSRYPFDGAVQLRFLKPQSNVKLFVPEGVVVEAIRVDIDGAATDWTIENGWLSWTGEGKIVSIDMPIRAELRPALDEAGGLSAWWYGPMILGSETANACRLPLMHMGNGVHRDADGRLWAPLAALWQLADIPADNAEFAANPLNDRRTRRFFLWK